jgi:hypothetical protein
MAQIVWPGDVNNNGTVNEVDLLYLGFAFGESGAARVAGNADWSAQEIAENWDKSFPNGLNFAYADCNGDGQVDEADAMVIQQNFANTHDDVEFIADEILNAIPEIDPTFSFLNQDFSVKPGEAIDLNISLGSDQLPVENLLGLAFNIKVNPKFVQTELTQFAFEDVAWIQPFGNQNTKLTIEDEANGKITVAFTTTDKKSVSGAGLIGTVSIIIVEDIVDLLVKTDTLKVEIDSITVVTDSLKKIPIGKATAILEVEGRSTATYDPILNDIKLYPNPTSGWVLLKTNAVSLDKVALVNALGQEIYQKKSNNNLFQSLDFQQIPKGLYWLKLVSKHGIRSIPIQKL